MTGIPVERLQEFNAQYGIDLRALRSDSRS